MTKTKGYGSITMIREPLPPELRGKRGPDGKPLQGKPKKDRDGKGIWLIRLFLGVDAKERPHRYVHGSKADARRELAVWKSEVDNGLKVDAGDVTLSAYAETWQADRRAFGKVRPSTLESDVYIIRAICSYLGDVKLSELDAATIKATYSRMVDDGVSADALHKRHLKLKQILDSATDDDLILRNPCKKVSVANPSRVEIRNSLTAEQAARLLDVLDEAGDTDSRIVAVRIGLATGMRISEVMGLTWEHVDLESGTVEVVQQHTAKYGNVEPKTRSSVRTVELDPDTVGHLAMWKEEQARQLARIWTKQKPGTPVITDDKGGFHDPGNYRRWFQNFCVLNGYGKWVTDDGDNVEAIRYGADGKRADGNGTDAGGHQYSRSNPRYPKGADGKPKRPAKHYSGLCFHELRHTQGTLLIADGEDIVTVSHRLGHAKPSTTLDMYSHYVPTKGREAAERFGSIMKRTKPELGKVVGLNG